MSYQLEREMRDRVNRYRHEAEVRRSVPGRSLRAAIASMLRKLADGLEPGQPCRDPVGRQLDHLLPDERSTIVLHGRNP